MIIVLQERRKTSAIKLVNRFFSISQRNVWISLSFSLEELRFLEFSSNFLYLWWFSKDQSSFSQKSNTIKLQLKGEIKLKCIAKPSSQMAFISNLLINVGLTIIISFKNHCGNKKMIKRVIIGRNKIFYSRLLTIKHRYLTLFHIKSSYYLIFWLFYYFIALVVLCLSHRSFLYCCQLLFVIGKHFIIGSNLLCNLKEWI